MSAAELQSVALWHLREAQRLLEQSREVDDSFNGSPAEHALEWSLPDAIGYLEPDEPDEPTAPRPRLSIVR